VSRKNTGRDEFDMSEETADRSLDLLFKSPASGVKVEFQGGEPLLNLPLIEHITERAQWLNKRHEKHLSFVVATNLALLDDEAIDYAAAAAPSSRLHSTDQANSTTPTVRDPVATAGASGGRHRACPH